jgi:hypothetical protein
MLNSSSNSINLSPKSATSPSSRSSSSSSFSSSFHNDLLCKNNKTVKANSQPNDYEENYDELELDIEDDENQPQKSQETNSRILSSASGGDLKTSDQQSLSFYCKICDKSFENLNRLQRHMLCHDANPELRKFKCDFCNKAFKFKHHLKVKIFHSKYF